MFRTDVLTLGRKQNHDESSKLLYQQHLDRRSHRRGTRRLGSDDARARMTASQPGRAAGEHGDGRMNLYTHPERIDLAAAER